MSPQYQERFNTALQRLTVEVYNTRCDLASWDALRRRRDEVKKSIILSHAASAIQSDLLIRLIRIFEDAKEVASFWYLYRCDPGQVGGGLNIERLREFSGRLKSVRDKSFVHIDRKGVFDAQAPYRSANIKHSEIRANLEMVWQIVSQLQLKLFGTNAPRSVLDRTLVQLDEVYQRSLAVLLDD